MENDVKIIGDFDKTIDVAMKFDIRLVVLRYMRKQNVSKDRAQRVANEMLRYLCLCATQPDHEWIVTGEVDEMWHTFILFTQDYEKFCRETFGFFLHHVPAEAGRETDVASGLEGRTVGEGYELTIVGYQRVLGFAPDPSIWPTRSMLEIGQQPMPCGCGGGGPPESACGCSRPKTCYPGGRP